MTCLADLSSATSISHSLPTPRASPATCSPASTVYLSTSEARSDSFPGKRTLSTPEGAALRRYLSADTLCNGSAPSAGATTGAINFSEAPDYSSIAAASHSVNAGRSQRRSSKKQYSNKLLADCLNTLQFCWYGACSHQHCRQDLETLSPPFPALLEHLQRVQTESAVLSSYIERLILLVEIKPAVLERAMDYVRRLRRKIDLAALDSAKGPAPNTRAQSLYYASRTWGTCYLVFVSACMVSQKFMEDEAGPRLSAYAAAGGFPKMALRTAEREMLGMLGYEIW